MLKILKVRRFMGNERRRPGRLAGLYRGHPCTQLCWQDRGLSLWQTEAALLWGQVSWVVGIWLRAL